MIVLVGFMGAGKTTVGRLLADRITVPFVDADEAIVAAQGRSIADIFTAEGETGFRRSVAVWMAVLHAGEEVVPPLGGGARAGDGDLARALARITPAPGGTTHSGLPGVGLRADDPRSRGDDAVVGTSPWDSPG